MCSKQIIAEQLPCLGRQQTLQIHSKTAATGKDMVIMTARGSSMILSVSNFLTRVYWQEGGPGMQTPVTELI